MDSAQGSNKVLKKWWLDRLEMPSWDDRTVCSAASANVPNLLIIAWIEFHLLCSDPLFMYLPRTRSKEEMCNVFSSNWGFFLVENPYICWDAGYLKNSAPNELEFWKITSLMYFRRFILQTITANTNLTENIHFWDIYVAFAYCTNCTSG